MSMMANRLSFIYGSLIQPPPAIMDWVSQAPPPHIMNFYCDLMNCGMQGSVPHQILEQVIDQNMYCPSMEDEMRKEQAKAQKKPRKRTPAKKARVKKVAKEKQPAKKNAKDKIIQRHRGTLCRCFENAVKYLWTFEQMLEFRSKEMLDKPDYQKLPFSDKRYLDGIWDAMYRAFDAQLAWTHVLDGVRFDGWDRKNDERRKGREHEINAADVSCFCYRRTVDGQEIFVPFRKEDRTKEFARCPLLSGKAARAMGV